MADVVNFKGNKVMLMLWFNLCFTFVYRPNDSRMLVALGESYEKLNSVQQAKKVSKFCYNLISYIRPYFVHTNWTGFTGTNFTVK